jgi:hypothetical protein
MTEKDADKLERWLLGKTALTRAVGQKLLNAAFADETILRQRHYLLRPAIRARQTPTDDWEDAGLRIRGT